MKSSYKAQDGRKLTNKTVVRKWIVEDTCVITWLTQGWVSSVTVCGGQTPPVTLPVFQSNTQGLLHRQERDMTSKWRTDGGPCQRILKKDSDFYTKFPQIDPISDLYNGQLKILTDPKFLTMNCKTLIFRIFNQ